jgi:hypothetical protein
MENGLKVQVEQASACEVYSLHGQNQTDLQPVPIFKYEEIEAAKEHFALLPILQGKIATRKDRSIDSRRA